MLNLKLKILEEEEYSTWDNFCEDSPNYSIFSSSLWLKILNFAEDGTAEVLGVYNKENLIGGLLVFQRKKGPFKVAAYPPLTPFTSIIFSKPSSKRFSKIESYNKDIIKTISDYLKSRFDFISLLLHPNIIDIRNFLWERWNFGINYTYDTDLTNIQDLWQNLDKKSKYDINKGINSNLELTREENIDEFYRLYELTFSKQDRTPPIKKEFIKSMYYLLRKEGKCQLYFAKSKEINISSALIIWDKKKAYYLLAASDPQFKLGAPSFLIWKIIEDLSKNFNSLDLCGANTDNIVKFKRDFATKLVPYYFVEKKSFFADLAFRLYQKIM